MAENLDTSLTVEAWAEITIKEWLKKIKAMGIGSSGQLLNSFYHHINTSADGKPQYVNFAFEYYGRFVDWGVGKGVTIENRDMLNTSRKQKPWFSSVFMTQLAVLKHLMAEKYAEKAAVVVINDMQSGNKKATGGSSTSSSGSTSSKSDLGLNKMTYKEFLERRKQNGW